MRTKSVLLSLPRQPLDQPLHFIPVSRVYPELFEDVTLAVRRGARPRVARALPVDPTGAVGDRHGGGRGAGARGRRLCVAEASGDGGDCGGVAGVMGILPPSGGETPERVKPT